jgi:hypothetical protein
MNNKMKTITISSRYGDSRSFVPVSENIYKFEGKTEFARFGGQEYAESVNMNDLGFFDPDGGPFISAGYPIGSRKVKRIMSKEDGIYFEVE